MITAKINNNSTRIATVIFLLSVLTFIYWFLVAYIIIDVYKIIIVGVIFEMLWLPMMIFLVLLPIVSIIQLVKIKFTFKQLSLYSLLINSTTVAILLFR